MKEERVNEIMDDITEDSSLCIIREALTQFEEETEKKQFYLVTYNNNCGLDEIEGVFTKESFNKYLKERNKERKEQGELIENENEFKFKEIEVFHQLF